MSKQKIWWTWPLILAGLFLGGCNPSRSESQSALQPGQSIQALIDQARPGETIVLSRGTWVENLRLEKSVTLRGAGPEATILKAAQPGLPVIWIQGQAEVRLEGLTIQEGRGGYVSPALSSAGVFVQDTAHAVLERVHIQDHGASGIFARDQAQVTLIAAAVLNNTRYGLELSGNAKAALDGSRVAQNKMGGIWLAEEAALEADQSEVSENAGPGIWARDAASLRLFGSKLVANTKHAVFVQDQANAVLVGTQAARHGGSGVYIAAQADVRAYGSSFEENWNGLELTGGRTYLERCFVRNSRWDGINARAGTLEVHFTHLEGGRGAGLNVSGTASVKILSSAITGFALAGVSGFSRHPVQGEETTLGKNGVDLMGHVDPRLRRPLATAERLHVQVEGAVEDLQTIVDSLRPGGTIVLPAGRFAAGLTIDKPLVIQGQGTILVGKPEAPAISVVQGGELRLIGVHVTGGSEGLALSAGSRAELNDCALWENGTGIKLWQDAQLSARRISVAHNSQGGLWLWDQAQAELTEATFQDNEVCGVAAGGRSKLVLRRSTFLNNGWQGGLMLRDSAEVELYENIFVRNRGYGISVQSRACVGSGPGFFGSVRGFGNVFEDNYKGPSCPEALALTVD